MSSMLWKSSNNQGKTLAKAVKAERMERLVGNRTPVNALAECLADQEGKGRQFRHALLTVSDKYANILRTYQKRAESILLKLNDKGYELVEVISE